MSYAACRMTCLTAHLRYIYVMVRNEELPDTGQATKQLALSVRQALEAKGVTQGEVGRIIGRAQSYASLRIKGMKPWTIDELDKLAPILGYDDVFALVNAMRQTQVNVDAGSHFIDSDMAQSIADSLDQFDIAAKYGDTEREQEAFEEQP